AHADQYNAVDLKIPSSGKLEVNFTPNNGKSEVHKVYEYNDNGGVGMAMYNTTDSIREFAHSCFIYALNEKVPLYLSTKNTILKSYDGAFMDIFSEVFKEYKDKFEK